MLLILPYLLTSVKRYLFERSTCCSPGGRARQLGLLEEMMERSHKDEVLMMSRVVFMESKQEISREHVTIAWEHLMRKYPILRVKIIEYQAKLHWCEMEGARPDITFHEDGNWLACLEDNSTFTYDLGSGPLWRVVLVSNVKSPYTDLGHFKYQYALLFGFHHALFDGTSNLLVLNDFQLILNTLVNGTVVSLPAVVSTEHIDKPLDEYMTLQLSFWEKAICVLYCIPLLGFITRYVQSYRLMKVFQQENLYMKHIGNFLLKPENKTSLKQIVLTKQESQQLFALCKKRKVTVQSLLQTASSIALCQLLRNPVLCRNVANVPNLLPVHVNCMLGMKSLVQSIPANSLGYFATILFCKLDISEFSDLWDLAAQTQHQLHNDQRRLAGDNFKNVFLYMKANINANNLLRDITSSGRYPGLLMAYSNLGNCRFIEMDESSQVRINGQVAACSEHKVGAIFSHSVVTLLGCLHWNVGYYKNISSEEVVDFYVKETKRIVMEAIQQDTPKETELINT